MSISRGANTAASTGGEGGRTWEDGVQRVEGEEEMEERGWVEVTVEW